MSYSALDHSHPADFRHAVVVGSAAWTGPAAFDAGLQTLLDEAKIAAARDRSRARACLERALQLLTLEGERADQSVGGLAKWQVSRVSAYIRDHIGEQIRVTDLAAAARLSPGHFSRRFRVSFGEKPLAYLARKRVEFAQRLMLNSPAPLAMLALDAGFCDQAHFTRVFKRTTGASPRAWLRTQGAEPQPVAG